jgi:hypothetical protein
MKKLNKLECLSLEILSSQVLEFEGKARVNPMEHLSDASFLGKLLLLPANNRLDWKVIASYEPSNFFGLFISNKGKKFYNIRPRLRTCLFSNVAKYWGVFGPCLKFASLNVYPSVALPSTQTSGCGAPLCGHAPYHTYKYWNIRR